MIKTFLTATLLLLSTQAFAWEPLNEFVGTESEAICQAIAGARGPQLERAAKAAGAFTTDPLWICRLETTWTFGYQNPGRPQIYFPYGLACAVTKNETAAERAQNPHGVIEATEYGATFSIRCTP